MACVCVVPSHVVHGVQTASAVAVHAVDAQPPLALQSVHATQLEPERKVEPATHEESEASSVKPPIPPPSWLNLTQLPRCA